MKTVFSDNDLLLFLYDEMPFDEADALVKALSTDEELLSRYEFFQQTSSQIGSVVFEPSDAIIEAIEEAAKQEMKVPPPKKSVWKMAFLTTVCLIAFGVSAFLGTPTTSNNNQSAAAVSVIVPVSSESEAVWDDDSFSNQIENLENRTKALQDPIL
ncbi:MAG: hypothetical protein AB8F95_16170 [Bacteroidia bacterium]